MAQPQPSVTITTVPRLPRKFFARDTVVVARELLGLCLVRVCNDQHLAGLITETEAYVGEDDLACHARAGRTSRTEVMYGPPGHAYIYFNYGLHWLLNIVTERAGYPAAVLIRGLAPVRGIEAMRRHRSGQPDRRLADGPAKLTQALSVNGALNGADLCARPAELYIERAASPPPARIIAAPRVGIDGVPEPWRSVKWNFKLMTG